LKTLNTEFSHVENLIPRICLQIYFGHMTTLLNLKFKFSMEQYFRININRDAFW